MKELRKSKYYWAEAMSNELWRNSWLPSWLCDIIAKRIATDYFIERLIKTTL